MKKILGLALAAFMVMGLVGGGTWAYFSDPESTTGNVFAAGTLDLQVNSENPWTTAYVNITDLAPGTVSANTTITLENVGNMTGDVHLRITSAVDGAGPDLFTSDGEWASSEPEWTAGGGVVGVGGYAETDNMSDNLVLNCIVDSAAVSNIDQQDITTAVSNSWQKIKDDIAASGTLTFELSATMPSNLGNEFQGDNVTFTIEFMLTQVDQTP